MRICMVGSGRMAGVHSRCFRQLPGVTLDTVVSTDRKALKPFAKEFGYGRATSSLGEALQDSDLDAVVICTPSSLHASRQGEAPSLGVGSGPGGAGGRERPRLRVG